MNQEEPTCTILEDDDLYWLASQVTWLVDDNDDDYLALLPQVEDMTPKKGNVYDQSMNEVNGSLSYLNYEEFMAWLDQANSKDKKQ